MSNNHLVVVRNRCKKIDVVHELDKSHLWKNKTYHGTMSRLINIDSLGCDKFGEKTGIGLLINYNEILYIITCLHLTKDHFKLTMNYSTTDNENVEYDLIKQKDIPEFDMSILKIDLYDVQTISYLKSYAKQINESDCVFDISEIENVKNKFAIHTLFENTDKTYDDKYLDTSDASVNLDYIKTKLLPKFPIISIKTKDKLSDYYGLSGSLLESCDTKKIFGMISGYKKTTDTIIIIPIFYISYILDLIRKELYESCLKGIIITTNICSYDEDKSKYGHLIISNTDISYDTIDNDKFKFKNNDIIETIDGQQFNEKGMIYYRDMNYYVPLDIFLLLSNTKTTFTISYFRKIRNEYLSETKEIFLREITDCLNIHISEPKIYFIIQGLILTELSEELLIRYNDLGFHLDGLANDIYANDPYSDNKKYVVIVGMLSNRINKILTSRYETIGLPLIHLKNNRRAISIIKKINGSNVRDISSFSEIASDKKKIGEKVTAIIYATTKKKYILDF
jgi:hypothetical protein